LFLEDVRKDLLDADLVSVKIDALTEDVWKKVNGPHPGLKLAEILEGIKKFAGVFKGKLVTRDNARK